VARLKVLDLGCGAIPYEHEGDEVVHLDKRALPHVEVVFDLNRTSPYFGGEKLPFNDESFDMVLALDIIEHIIDVIPLFEEIYRVLKKGGQLIIRTTNWKTENSFRDPTHYHYFTLESLDYFDPNSRLFERYGHVSNARFKVEERRCDGQELVFKLTKI